MLALLGACGSVEPMETVEYVDLSRFMGDWYVIACIPTFVEEDAWNAVESYRLDEDGTVATTFTFRDGGPGGEYKTYTPRGFVRDRQTNAVWGMQFVWPIKADYRVIYLDPDYEVTVIGRKQRDHVWLMARTPSLGDAEYRQLVAFIGSVGYDTGKLRRVPQQW